MQHCLLNERVQQLQHNAAAQLTPPPPHTAYEQLATMVVNKIPRNNIRTHNSQNISPPPHSSPNPSIPRYISPGSTATYRIQTPTNFIQAQAAKTLREMEGVHVSRLSLVSNISFLIILNLEPSWAPIHVTTPFPQILRFPKHWHDKGVTVLHKK